MHPNCTLIWPCSQLKTGKFNLKICSVFSITHRWFLYACLQYIHCLHTNLILCLYYASQYFLCYLFGINIAWVCFSANSCYRPDRFFVFYFFLLSFRGLLVYPKLKENTKTLLCFSVNFFLSVENVLKAYHPSMFK